MRVSGPDRLTWLHSLTTQYFEGLPAGRWTEALILSPQGHVEHAFAGVDDGEAFTAHTEPGAAAALVEFLDRMRFMMRVEVADVTDELAVTWRPARGRRARRTSSSRATGSRRTPPRPATPRGTWAFEALRIARGEPRFGLDTDHRTIPNEVGWIGPAVHLDKGCYRGQETVARVHTLGRPPRRLTLLHLDGTENRLPAAGRRAPARRQGRRASSAPRPATTSSARSRWRWSSGTSPLDATLEADGMPAAQEVVVDPEVGLHVRPNLR